MTDFIFIQDVVLNRPFILPENLETSSVLSNITLKTVWSYRGFQDPFTHSLYGTLSTLPYRDFE